MKRAFLAASVLFAAITVIGAAHASPGTLVVDKDKVQCPKADFTSIQAAVTAAQPGDKIKVCPDLYNEDVTVNKPLTLQATSKPDVDSCSTPAPADPAQNAIVDGVSFSFNLQANQIVLDGFVVQGSTAGVLTSDAFSGYWIRNNVIQNNAEPGVNFLSSGASESRIGHNCFRSDGSGGVSSEGGDLRNARLDHNNEFQMGGFDLSGAGARQDVTIDHNRSREDPAAFLLSNSTGSSITHNDAALNVISILIGGGNVGLEISHNVLRDGQSTGVLFSPLSFFPVFPTPSIATQVSNNDISGFGLDGIRGNANSIASSTISDNKTTQNGRDGILLRVGNTDNVVSNNQSDQNGRDGIHAQGATGNLFTDNHMADNAEFDARDDNRPANTWTKNHCTTDFPPGTICGV